MQEQTKMHREKHEQILVAYHKHVSNGSQMSLYEKKPAKNEKNKTKEKEMKKKLITIDMIYTYVSVCMYECMYMYCINYQL